MFIFRVLNNSYVYWIAKTFRALFINSFCSHLEISQVDSVRLINKEFTYGSKLESVYQSCGRSWPSAFSHEINIFQVSRNVNALVHGYGKSDRCGGYFFDIASREAVRIDAIYLG